MATKTVDGIAVDVNPEGFFERPEQWTEAMAPALAEAAGVSFATAHPWCCPSAIASSPTQVASRSSCARDPTAS